MGSSSSRGARKHRIAAPTITQCVVNERDAWEIALAWRDQLRGCVRLELDSEELLSSIIPVFEWVTFVFDGALEEGLRPIKDPAKTAAYARAASIAWFALSCCEGFSGVENPRFWKRVFYELLYPKDLPVVGKRGYAKRGQIPITDAVRFFSQPDRPFPRIKLGVWENDHDAMIASVFMGLRSCEDTERDTKLRQILVKLEPFIRASEMMRRVPIEVEMLAPLSTTPATHLRNFPTTSGDVEPEAAVSVVGLMDFRQLYVQSVALLSTAVEPSIKDLHLRIPPSNLEVRMRGLSLLRFVHDHQLCQGLLEQLETNSQKASDRRWRVTDLRVMQSSQLSYSYLSVLCSALPHLPSIHAVILPADRYSEGNPVSIASDWAWVGYAIFHPDTASLSSFASLEIDLDGVTPTDITDIAKMSVGNNLLGDRIGGYIEGLVQRGTEVRIHPRSDEELSLFMFSAESWVSLCVPAADVIELQDWICIVVQGFGSGWILRNDITKTRSRQAGKSCLRTLRVNSRTKDVSDGILLGLLRVLGSRLTSLYFQDDLYVSASTILSVMRLCPSLKSLRLYHAGSFWADKALAMETPQLEELELTIKGVNTAFRPLRCLKPACLPYLKALRVVSKAEGCYGYQEPILLSFLSEQPVLQYLHWSRGLDMVPAWVDGSSYHCNNTTHNFLERLSAEKQLCDGPLRLRDRVAFLSVLSEKGRQSRVGLLGEDVVKRVFQYATSYSQREIFINP